MSSYGGESNAKKIARLHMWRAFRKTIGAKQVAQGTVAVLSGPDGCDVRVARAMGFKNITAIDLDAAALDNAKQQLVYMENVEWICDDFASVITGQRFDAVFFDSCSTILGVMQRTFDALCAVRGRSMPPNPGALMQEHTQVAVAGMYGRDGKYTDERFTGEAAERRTKQVLHQAMEIAAKNQAIYFMQRAWSYRSSRIDTDNKVRGVPMLYTFGSFIRNDIDSTCSSRRARRRAAKFSRVAKSRLNTFSSVTHIVDDLKGSKVRQLAVQLSAHSTRSAAELLCLKETQVRAWLAVDTRRKNEQ